MINKQTNNDLRCVSKQIARHVSNLFSRQLVSPGRDDWGVCVGVGVGVGLHSARGDDDGCRAQTPGDSMEAGGV